LSSTSRRSTARTWYLRWRGCWVSVLRRSSCLAFCKAVAVAGSGIHFPFTKLLPLSETKTSLCGGTLAVLKTWPNGMRDMTLSRPIASGAMLVLLVAAVGGAAVQQGNETPEAGVVEISDATPPATQNEDASDAVETEAVDEVERTAAAPNRVVESAGFPVVPQAERDRGQTETAGPVVTVNGR